MTEGGTIFPGLPWEPHISTSRSSPPILIPCCRTAIRFREVGQLHIEILCEDLSCVVKVLVSVKPADQVVDVQGSLFLDGTSLSPTEVRPTAPEPDEPLATMTWKAFLNSLGSSSFRGFMMKRGQSVIRRPDLKRPYLSRKSCSIRGRCRQFFICFGFTLPLRAGGNLSSVSAKTFGWSSGSKTRNSSP